MIYTFEILGVSPVLHFFNHQQSLLQNRPKTGVEYLGSFACTLDAVLKPVEEVSYRHGWEIDQAINAVIQFWLNNSDTIDYWKARLSDAGSQSLLVSRFGSMRSLQTEFEFLLTDR
ncbi:MAG TPA: hypothetical protein IGS53_03365 [Leptolyngbyaceae cyanobacterium M33_DOE_097]|uniref:Uncharacterized protein n=1 Tax=Oscillatoriales cyanobacterium SpSt-418 TaxID=2282169 RepID=A0A7C3PJI0_9CYAN|nr:hypothetical protein [Leptolyngbyaceae cyanobacterium M33_DOE_097]